MIDELKMKYYGRYVDDFFFIIRNKKNIKYVLTLIKNKLKTMGVKLHPKKLYIQHYSKGVKFIGAVIKPNRIYISNRTKGNFYYSLKVYNKNIMDGDKIPTFDEIENFVSSINSYLGFLVHYKTFNIRKKLLLSNLMKPWLDFCYFDGKGKKIKSFYEYTKKIGKKKRYTKYAYHMSNMDFFTLINLSKEFREVYYGIF